MLIHPNAPVDTGDVLFKAILDLTDKLNVSSLHINFCNYEEMKYFKSKKLLIRVGEQFHFINKNYNLFEDFLKDLSSKKRKKIIKERKAIVDNGISINVLKGKQINSSVYDNLYKFYLSTIQKKWGTDYLTKNFFQNLSKAMESNIIIIMALRGSEPVGAAINFIGNDTLYGRHWGCSENIPFLHFEVCYYKAIEVAINMGLKKVEAGAQGPHKIQRGYLPKPTYSAHLIKDDTLRNAVSDFLAMESKAVYNEIEYISNNYSPYKKQ